MRLQLALDVTDLDAAVDFYTRLFDTPPAKREPGYANFAIAQPPLKLVLFEAATDGTINHLGVEVEHPDEVDDAAARLASAGLAPTSVAATTCCHADKVETWVHGPDGTRWEYYVKTADVPTQQDDRDPAGAEPDSACACGVVAASTPSGAECCPA